MFSDQKPDMFFPDSEELIQPLCRLISHNAVFAVNQLLHYFRQTHFDQHFQLRSLHISSKIICRVKLADLRSIFPDRTVLEDRPLQLPICLCHNRRGFNVDIPISIQVAVIPEVLSIDITVLVIIRLNFFSRIKIGPCNFHSGELFARVVHFQSLFPGDQPQPPDFRHLNVSQYHSNLFVFLSEEQMNFSFLLSVDLSLALVLPACPAHRTRSEISLPWFFFQMLKLGFVGDPAFPSDVRDTPAFTACDLGAASALFVVQVMSFVEIQPFCPS